MVRAHRCLDRRSRCSLQHGWGVNSMGTAAEIWGAQPVERFERSVLRTTVCVCAPQLYSAWGIIDGRPHVRVYTHTRVTCWNLDISLIAKTSPPMNLLTKRQLFYKIQGSLVYGTYSPLESRGLVQKSLKSARAAKGSAWWEHRWSGRTWAVASIRHWYLYSICHIDFLRIEMPRVRIVSTDTLQWLCVLVSDESGCLTMMKCPFQETKPWSTVPT